jgi:hypothetical protein
MFFTCRLNFSKPPALSTNANLTSSSYRPASCEVPDIIRLMDAGMTMARFNMSHGTKKVRTGAPNRRYLHLNFFAIGQRKDDPQVLRGTQA